MQWREQRPRLDKENGYRGCLVIIFVITHTLRFLFAVLAVRISKCDRVREALLTAFKTTFSDSHEFDDDSES